MATGSTASTGAVAAIEMRSAGDAPRSCCSSLALVCTDVQDQDRLPAVDGILARAAVKPMAIPRDGPGEGRCRASVMRRFGVLPRDHRSREDRARN
jgi:hypothetical protein